MSVAYHVAIANAPVHELDKNEPATSTKAGFVVSTLMNARGAVRPCVHSSSQYYLKYRLLSIDKSFGNVELNVLSVGRLPHIMTRVTTCDRDTKYIALLVTETRLGSVYNPRRWWVFS